METREAAEQAAASFIARRDSGPWTENDATALQRWLAESASHRAAYYRLNAAWTEAGRLRVLAAGPASTEPARVEHSPQRQYKSRFFALAASVLMAAVAVSIWYEVSYQRNTYSTPIGATETIPLADGTRVTLNTNSALHISFTERERRITLDRGEGYFEVAHDTARPFIVRAGERRVVAVGTQFSVRRDQDDVRVSVTEGTVRFEEEGVESPRAPRDGTAAAKEVLLPPGSIAIAHAEREAVLVQKRPVAEVEQSLSWRTGLLTFRDTPLSDAVAEFNRYNTRRIVIEDPTIERIQVGGIFRPTNIDAFVHLLEEGFPVHASVQGDTIVLTSRR
jgi:transmembrane sensor